MYAQAMAVAEIQSVGTVTLGELQVMQNCGEAYKIRKLHLTNPETKWRNFARAGLEVIKRSVFEDKNPEIELNAYFNKGFKEEWFESPILHSIQKNVELKKLRRMAEYLGRNYEVEATNVRYAIPYEFNFRGYQIDGIQGSCDFILKKDGMFTAVLVKSSELKFSKSAHREDRKPCNSLELIGLYLGLIEKYGKDMKVAMWSLKNKDDNGVNLVAEFEQRQGKNIVEMDFSKEDVQTLQNRFESLLETNEVRDCENCRNWHLCKISKEIRKESVEKRKDYKQIAKGLTEAQKLVVNHKEGPMAVLAVPGAGKTHSLIHRMKRLIDNGVKPAEILFISFTKKACNEIRERVISILPKGNDMPVVATYNSFGFSCLRENESLLGQKIHLATETERLALIKQAVLICPVINGVSYSFLNGEYGLVKTLSRLFEEIDETGKEAFVHRYKEKKDTDGILTVYEKYRFLYRKHNYISYDDQVTLTVELFRTHPELAEKYANHYRYIMIDEFQDSSEEQVDMLYAIAKYHNNIVVVGDDDQSIYGWRGGSLKYLLEFRKDFPVAKIVQMGDNFRSNPGIIEAASALIKGNGKRYEKRFVPHIEKCGYPVYLAGCDKEYIKVIIARAVKGNAALGSIAVIARNNRKLAEVEEILEGFCKVATPKDYLVDDALFQSIFDVMHFYYSNMKADEALYRIIKRFGYGMPLKNTAGCQTLYDGLVAAGIFAINAYQAKGIQKQLFQCISVLDQVENIPDVLKGIASILYGIEEHRVLNTLSEAAEERGFVKPKELFQMMSDMTEFDSRERVGYEPAEDAVNLLTAHDSKGKEFEHVILYGVEDFSGEEEEVRVLYVAMTRAKRNLFMMQTSLQPFPLLDKFRRNVKLIGFQ